MMWPPSCTKTYCRIEHFKTLAMQFSPQIEPQTSPNVQTRPETSEWTFRHSKQLSPINGIHSKFKPKTKIARLLFSSGFSPETDFSERISDFLVLLVEKSAERIRILHSLDFYFLKKVLNGFGFSILWIFTFFEKCWTDFDFGFCGFLLLKVPDSGRTPNTAPGGGAL